jgi:hypothetical protein
MLTPEQRKEIADFYETLEGWQQEYVDDLTKAKGESHVYSILGWLKDQAEYTANLL